MTAENIHTLPMEGHWKFPSGWGISKLKIFKGTYVAELEVPEGWVRFGFKPKKTCVGEGNGYILEQNNKNFELSYHSFKNGILNSLCHCWEELLARFCVNFTLHISKRCCKILTNVMEWQQY